MANGNGLLDSIKRIMVTVFAALIVASIIGVVGVNVKANTNTVKIESIRDNESRIERKIDRLDEKIDRLIERR